MRLYPHRTAKDADRHFAGRGASMAAIARTLASGENHDHQGAGQRTHFLGGYPRSTPLEPIIAQAA